MTSAIQVTADALDRFWEKRLGPVFAKWLTPTPSQRQFQEHQEQNDALQGLGVVGQVARQLHGRKPSDWWLEVRGLVLEYPPAAANPPLVACSETPAPHQAIENRLKELGVEVLAMIAAANAPSES